MDRPTLAICAALVCTLGSEGCDPYIIANATAPLVAPVDSVCLKDALESRLGSPTMRSRVERRDWWRPTTLWLYYGGASFAQTYPDTGAATLHAAEIVAAGLQAIFSPPREVQDSVSRQLGRELVVARDACGGRAPPNRPDFTVAR